VEYYQKQNATVFGKWDKVVVIPIKWQQPTQRVLQFVADNCFEMQKAVANKMDMLP